MTDPYQASPLKRRRRTRAQVETLDNQIVDILRDDHPQSIRHVFYRLTDPRLDEPVEKSDRGYSHVQSRLVKLRREGVAPYGWVADMSRRGYFIDTFSGADDFLSRVHGLYRADLWKGASCCCEVWCESRSIASVIQTVCRELAVSLYPCGGFSSISFVHEAAQEINERDDNRPIVVFYIGDYDAAGVLIDVALKQELRLHLRNDIKLHFVRLGITQDQIRRFDLPEKPRNEGDKRAPHIKHTVEAEAMPAHILRQIVRDAVEALLPPDALRIARVAEQSERMKLIELATDIRKARGR